MDLIYWLVRAYSRDGVKGVDNGIFILANCEYYFIRVHKNPVQYLLYEDSNLPDSVLTGIFSPVNLILPPVIISLPILTIITAPASLLLPVLLLPVLLLSLGRSLKKH